MKPGDIMATGIEESLAERGLTMAILELIDEDCGNATNR